MSVGYTTVVDDSLHPCYVLSILIDAHFDRNRPLHISSTSLSLTCYCAELPLRAGLIGAM